MFNPFPDLGPFVSSFITLMDRITEALESIARSLGALARKYGEWDD